MAPKRNEPSASAAPSEEEESSSESTAATKEQEDSEEEDDSSESEPEKPQLQTRDQQPNRQPLSQPKHTPPPPSTAATKEQEDSEEDDDDDSSESEPERPQLQTRDQQPYTQPLSQPKHTPPPPSTAATKEQEDSEEEEDDDDSSESEPERRQLQTRDQQPNRQPLSQPKHTPPPPSTAATKEQEDSSESDSMSDTESEPNIPLKNNLETLKSKNPRPQPPSPSKPTSLKRPSGSDNSKQRNNKRKKSSLEGSSEDTLGAASDKKPLFQRLWSDEDEIALLKGMVEYVEKKGVNPVQHMNEFYKFVKKDIKMDASQSQLVNKIRGLRKKFKKNNVGKGSKKPRDEKAFELMMKLWSAGKGTVPEEGLKMSETTKKKKSKSVLLKEGNTVSPKKDKNAVKNGSNPLSNKVGLFMDESMCVIEMSRLFPRSVDKVFLKGLELIGEKKRAELEDRWMKLRLAELKIEEERAVLFHEQRRLILDALS